MLRATDATLPIVCLQSVGRCTSAEIEEVHRVYMRAFHQPGRLICISDARLASHDVQQRRMLAAWSDRITPMGKHRVIATIVVLDSFVLRGALTAMNWLSTPVIPQRVVPDLATAIELGQELAAEHGLEVDPNRWGHVRMWLEMGYMRASAG
jgi:hypothetical protein